MPGYIIHLTEAEMILKALAEKGCSLKEEFKQEFRLGVLIPDTKMKKEKVSSHFWKEEDLDKLAIPAVLSAFEEKYRNQMESAVMLGYWTHLQLDEAFVNEFWPSMMTFLGKDGEEKILSKEIVAVHLKHQNRVIPVEQFFTSDYYYGDYDRTNHRFFQKYRLAVPVMKEDLFCPAEEVQVGDLNRVLEELQRMLARSPLNETRLQVLNEEELLLFLEKYAQKAADVIFQKFYPPRALF